MPERRVVATLAVATLAVATLLAVGCGSGATEESATESVVSSLTSTTANTFPPDPPTTVPAVSTSSTVKEGVTAKTVLVFGDSVSQGSFATTEADSYVGKLAVWLKSTYDISVFRLAWYGSKAEGVAEREAEILDLHPDIFILQVGTGEEATTDQFADSVIKALEIAVAANPEVKIVVCSSWRASSEKRDIIDWTLSTLAEQNGAPFVFLGSLRDDSRNIGPAGRSTFRGISDAAHPNDRGHQAIFDALAPVVEGLL
ncbi:MAG: SGNH/GDSL hydrolase family protein [Thermoleophilia bacterium]|nr:SGNH/GDSL hydrolase family protein [Thermoleophilia bacterium]